MTTVPRVDRAGGGLRAPLLVGLAGLGAAALLRVRDPHDSGSYGFCPFHYLTGLSCPGCGGLRAVNDLGRGDVAAAVSSNVLAVALVASLTVLWIVWFVRRASGRSQAAFVVVTTRAALLALPFVVVFTVLRNTPWGSWLAP